MIMYLLKMLKLQKTEGQTYDNPWTEIIQKQKLRRVQTRAGVYLENTVVHFTLLPPKRCWKQCMTYQEGCVWPPDRLH